MSGQEDFLILGTKVRTPYPPKLTPAEVRLVFSLQKFFKPELILADYYLPKVNQQLKVQGKEAVTVAESEKLLQIDCLAVGLAGVFVFESKDYQGWMYGHGNRVHWTQVVKYGKEKHQFYSPVRQNAAHVDAVRSVVGDDIPLFSVIVFGRQAELKVVEDLPPDTQVCTQAGLYDVMGGFEDKITWEEARRLKDVLRASGVRPTAVVRDEHREEVEILSSKRQNCR